MIATSYLPQSALALVRACVLGAGLALLTPLTLAAKLPVDAGTTNDFYPALGISDDFGRWDKTVRLVYDPDGAPAAYSQNDKVLALVREAYGYWMQVSG